ncbi:MAG: tetratricopeptide (TPR) repeat protein [Candidatus Paceibacteria bacterium]|jgi:tetratricopeptide (TPR) repeat protein
MNTPTILFVSALLATAAGTVTSIALRPDAPIEAAEWSESMELAALRSEIESIAASLRDMDAAQTQLPVVDSGRRVDIDAIDKAVQRYFAGLTTDGLAVSAVGSDGPQQVQASLELEATLAELLMDGLSETDRASLWAKIREAGKLDEMIGLLEEHAELNKNDPDAQVDVASAYIQKIFEVGDGPEAGLWAGKADSAFDRALELDTEHWSARYSKSVSLSFWPPIFGKQSEAISNFETLVTQQEGNVQEDRYASTYLLLGNLYTQTGQVDRAKAIWNQGLGMFPGDESLLDKLADMQ